MTEPKPAIFQFTGDKTDQKHTSKYNTSSKTQPEVSWTLYCMEDSFFVTINNTGGSHRENATKQDSKGQEWTCLGEGGSFALPGVRGLLARTLRGHEEGEEDGAQCSSSQPWYYHCAEGNKDQPSEKRRHFRAGYSEPATVTCIVAEERESFIAEPMEGSGHVDWWLLMRKLEAANQQRAHHVTA